MRQNRIMQISKKQILYDTLRQRVLTLELAPGSALDETILSDEFGVSRTPLREMLQRLAGHGYLEITTNRGATVSSMNLVVMRNFFQTAPMIYASISRLAAENATAEQLVRLKAAQRQFRVAIKGRKIIDMAMSNHRFHEIIGEMAASPYLSPSLQRLQIDHTRMSQTFYKTRTRNDRERIDSACEQHEQLIEAIEQHQPATAVDITRQHWELSRHQFERYVQPDPLPIDPLSNDQATTQAPTQVDNHAL